MMLATRKALAAAAVLLAGAAAGGCDTVSSLNPFDTSGRYKQEILPEVPPQQLYNQGLARLQRGDTEGAARSFNDIEKQAAFSREARKGMVMTAFAHYEGGRFDEAANAARRFLTLHPSDPDAAYASTSWRCRSTGRSRTSGATRSAPNARSWPSRS